ncbi:sigma-70 family RNA polymerase sigma factor [Streptomyces iconiensis]|uniref:RNA polymerase sigma factor n=1 Tax=Streptomyces iconiensis TaxID=1384038 RepID=A0ABT7A1E8_9ACTN|nr:sigma-70 family RNA polymerase sigma factor [Streptomyces iconiensis]MDJ1134889.1 sigma-70 family RNA polymerase sigma factor [Streptomyces iconiensis]
MSSEPQYALIRAAQAGDQRARDRLTAAYLPLVYNIVGRALNGHADTDDVVQETMLRVLDGLGGLRSPESFRSWLVAITMNQVRGYWRRYGAEAAPPVSLEDTRAAPPVEDFVDATVLRLGLSGQRHETARATRWLDEDDRTLLSLWWLEAAGQLTRAEVAAAMELSPQHTAVRVQRMKSQLETARVVVRALAAEPPCVLLASLSSGWDGIPSPLWRKRLARHTRDCAVCSGRSSDLVPAERLLVGLALVPVVSTAVTAAASDLAAHSVAHHPAHSPTDPALAGATGSGAHASHSPGSGSSPGSGPGRALRRRRSRRRRRVTGLVAAAVVLSTGAGIVHLTTGPEEDGKRSRDVTARAEPAPSSHSPRPKPSPSPSSASPSASATSPSPSRTAKQPAKPRPSTPPPRPQTSPATREPAPAPRGPSHEVAALVNAERAKKGCGPVRTNDKLDTAASGHSADMAARDFFDHTNPDGKGPGDRITAAGYRWSTYGENIAKGQNSPEEVMKGWMNSPGHRANILNCSYKEMGLGLRQGQGGPWWTQAFGAR